MTTRFHLVRHAAYDNFGSFLAGRSLGVVLGAEGRRQAQRLAERLRTEPISAIYASPRERTQQTAQAVATALSLPIHSEAALDEIDFGPWSGRTFSSLAADPEWQRWNDARAISRTPAGDSMRAAQMRILDFMDRLSGKDAGFVLISHADVIKAALCYVLGLSFDRLDVIDIAPASLSTIEIEGWRARITRMNEHAP